MSEWTVRWWALADEEREAYKIRAKKERGAIADGSGLTDEEKEAAAVSTFKEIEKKVRTVFH